MNSIPYSIKYTNEANIFSVFSNRITFNTCIVYLCAMCLYWYYIYRRPFWTNSFLFHSADNRLCTLQTVRFSLYALSLHYDIRLSRGVHCVPCLCMLAYNFFNARFHRRCIFTKNIIIIFIFVVVFHFFSLFVSILCCSSLFVSLCTVF